MPGEPNLAASKRVGVGVEALASLEHVSDWHNVAGPVARSYELSRVPLTVIEGPTGGGKTQASARKILRVALWQHPSPRRNLRKAEYQGKQVWIGERRAKITVVAPTYPVLWDTAIPSYLKVFPQSWKNADGTGGWGGTRGRPAEHKFEVNSPDGGILHIEVDFRAINDEDVEDFMKGRETTAFWLPELTTHPAENLLSKASNRVGRFPEPEDRWDPDEAADLGWEPAYKGVFGDTNSPVIGSWFHDRFYVRRENRDGYYKQPPGILEGNKPNPAAENLHNLRKISIDYYGDLIRGGMDEYDVARLLGCKAGWSLNGKPVHNYFDDRRHVAARRIEIDRSLPVMVGIDGGNTLKFAAVFFQRSYSGQVRGLRVIAPRDGQIDLATGCAEVRRILDTDFQGLPAENVVDPSARAKTALDKTVSYAQLIQAHSKVPTRLAASNAPTIRRAALSKLLKRQAGPGEEALILDPEFCQDLIAALGGGFSYKKTGNVYSPEPEKNDHSHPAEAGEYGCLGLEGMGALTGGLSPPVGGAQHNGPGVILD